MPPTLEDELDRLNGIHFQYKHIETMMRKVHSQLERFEGAWARLQDANFRAANPQEAQKAMEYGRQ